VHRIDVATAAATPPPRQEPGTPGYFTSGNFIGGVKATIPGADWFNSVQAELANAVEASGQVLDRDDDAQLLQAIRSLINRARYRPGQIVISAGEPLEGTLLCDGSEVPRADYPELFAVIGTRYGAGDGSATFNLPLCKEGTTVTHTNSTDFVGVHSTGAVIAHAHTASTSAAGDHTHYIGVYGAGGHTHTASSGAAGDHAHGAWTDGQGNHNHGVNDPGHSHTWIGPSAGGGSGGWSAANISWPNNTGTSGSGTGIWLNDGGHHAHNIGMNGSGNHTHDVGVAGVGDHSHTLDNRGAGAHEHNITVNSAGGDDNLPAGLRMMYCIAY